MTWLIVHKSEGHGSNGSLVVGAVSPKCIMDKVGNEMGIPLTRRGPAPKWGKFPAFVGERGRDGGKFFPVLDPVFPWGKISHIYPRFPFPTFMKLQIYPSFIILIFVILKGI